MISPDVYEGITSLCTAEIPISIGLRNNSKNSRTDNIYIYIYIYIYIWRVFFISVKYVFGFICIHIYIHTYIWRVSFLSVKNIFLVSDIYIYIYIYIWHVSFLSVKICFWFQIYIYTACFFFICKNMFLVSDVLNVSLVMYFMLLFFTTIKNR